MRRVFWGLLFVAVTSAGCKGRKQQSAALPPPPPISRVDGGALAPPLVGAPRALVAALRESEHAAPDRRFVLAFDHVARILGGASASHATLRRGAAGGWVVDANDAPDASGPIAQLPDAPDFEPLMAAITAHAVRHAKSAKSAKSATGGVVEVPLAHEAIASLAAADAAWPNEAERPAAAQRAATALVGLIFGTADTLEVADELPARAIAAVAVARALGAPAPASIEALLARVLGYGAAAIRLAPKTTNDAVAAYAADDDPRLRKLSTSSPFARQAWLRRLVLRHDAPGARAWLARELARESDTVAVLAAQTLGFLNLETASDLAARFPPIALGEAMDAGGDLAGASGAAHDRLRALPPGDGDPADTMTAALDTSRAKILVAYDAALARLPRRDGIFRDATLERDYLDATMVSAMTCIESYLADSLGSPTEAARAARTLAEPTAPRTRAFRTWFAVMAAGTSTGKPEELVGHVSAESPLGGSPRAQIHSLIEGRLSGPMLAGLTRGLLGKLDSRPHHRTLAGEATSGTEGNPRAAEGLFRSASLVGGGAEPDADVLLAYRDRDPEAIDRFARRTASPPKSRAAVVAFALKEKIGERAALDALADLLLAEVPLDPSVHEIFQAFYEEADPTRARARAKAWLARRAGRAMGGLGDVGARRTLARILRRDKKYDEALGVLEPAVATGQAGAILELALTHAFAGHAAEAEKGAQQTLARYPQLAAATAALAQIRWMKGDPAGAAAALAAAPSPLTNQDVMDTVAPKFAELFAENPAGAVRAVDAFGAAKVEHMIGVLGMKLVHDRAFDLALAVLIPHDAQGGVLFGAAAQPTRKSYPVERRVLAFEAMRGARGKDTALAWLKQEIGSDESQYMQTVYLAFSLGSYDVLELDHPTPPSAPEDRAEIWTMRLAAQLRRDGRLTTADEARTAFASAPTARYSAYGRYLLGDIDAATVEKLATSTKTTCELAYYMAAKAAGEARHADAIDLLKVSTGTNSMRDGEYQAARNDVSRYGIASRAIAKLPPGVPPF